jgi:hypothetical protein
MHKTTRNRTLITARRSPFAGLVLAVALGAPSPVHSVGRDGEANVADLHDAFHQDTSHENRSVDDNSSNDGPHVIEGDVADVLVRVRGGDFCSGTPITGTLFVVTAAHCVLDQEGRVARRTVVRDGVTYEASSVLVDTRYFDSPSPSLDAAVLIMDRAVPGPSASLGQSIPSTGSVTLAGFQALDTDGTLLRGSGPHDAPMPKGATGTLIQIESAPAGCTVGVVDMTVTRDRVDVPCGLIPGASGGGLFALAGGSADGSVTLIGVVSTVAPDLSSNGVVPIESVLELLDQPEQYRHSMDDVTPASGGPRPVLS